ncbi:methylenetetrahydrofolate reductase (NADPH) isoform X1 [Hylaeus volcanicus]|uniref:methylenetetrahydrofolate reductase (NADPH) isoform X1 n=1 Tax=Hylaeus volcanicus TaxID=313075 RepID=UPI0023B82B4F|nr:methylenetetrahydrofolate reductase (NADPH) isoform X1 [Hylaeus volcanicus]
MNIFIAYLPRCSAFLFILSFFSRDYSHMELVTNSMYYTIRCYQNWSHIVPRIRRKYVVVTSVFFGDTMNKFVRENESREKPVGDSECNKVTSYFPPKNIGNEIVDLRKLLKDSFDAKFRFCSFELSPIKNNDFYQSFFAEINKYRPLFYALTWHTKNMAKDYPSLEVIRQFPSNTILHIVIGNLTRADILIILKKALDSGVINIFVLRGDSAIANTDFPHAVDLVRFIRNEFGNIFCICVAGYPEMHPESPSKELDLLYLKEKVDAGADLIITQVIFEADVFIKFVNDCNKIGINVPIIPGVLSIPSYASLEKMSKICNFRVPRGIVDILQPIKNNDDEVRNYGIELVTNVIKDILASGTTSGFHLFTLNRTSLSSEICKKLNISR